MFNNIANSICGLDNQNTWWTLQKDIYYYNTINKWDVTSNIKVDIS